MGCHSNTNGSQSPCLIAVGQSGNLPQLLVPSCTPQGVCEGNTCCDQTVSAASPPLPAGLVAIPPPPPPPPFSLPPLSVSLFFPCTAGGRPTVAACETNSAARRLSLGCSSRSFCLHGHNPCLDSAGRLHLAAAAVWKPKSNLHSVQTNQANLTASWINSRTYGS